MGFTLTEYKVFFCCYHAILHKNFICSCIHDQQYNLLNHLASTTIHVHNSMALALSQYTSLNTSGDDFFFTEEKIYWTPSEDTSVLYEQLAQKKYREILREQIQLVTFMLLRSSNDEIRTLILV